MSGVKLRAFQHVLTSALNGDPAAQELEDKILEAEAAAVDIHLKSAKQYAKENFRAHMELLKMLRPERFAAKSAVTITHQGAPPKQVLPPEDAQEKLYQYAVALFKERPEFLVRLRADLPKLLEE